MRNNRMMRLVMVWVVLAVAHFPGRVGAVELDSYVDRSFYTSEKEANLVVEFQQDKAELQGLRLEAALTRDGKTLNTWQRAELSGRIRVPVALSGLANGEYAVEVQLLDRAGKVIAASKEKLVKLPPSPINHEVKIDREKRNVLINGKPTFLLGFYDVPLKDLDMIKDAGFNSLAYHSGSPIPKEIEGALTVSKAAAAKGMYAMFSPVHLNLKFRNTRDNPDNIVNNLLPKYAEKIRPLKDAPFLAFYNWDEPGLTMERACRETYKVSKAANPYVPVFIIFPHKVHFSPEGASDVVCIDNYWSPGVHKMSRLVPWLQDASAIAVKNHMPFVSVPQVNLYSLASQSLTPRQQRAQTYLILTKHAQGIIWFSWGNSLYAELWKELESLAGEINTLAPVLLTPSPAQEVKTDNESIHLLLKEHQGALYLVVASLSREAQLVTFDVSSLEPSSSVEVVFADRTIKAEGNSFTDRIDGLGTRAYKLASNGSRDTHRITVASKGLKKFYDPKDFFANTRTSYSPAEDIVYVRGETATLSEIADDIGDPEVFSYDRATRTAVCKSGIQIEPGTTLMIGNRTDPALGETLLNCFPMNEMQVSGNVEIHKSRLIGCGAIKTRFEKPRVVIRDSEVSKCTNASPFGSKRPRGTRVYDIRGVNIHNLQQGLFYLGSNPTPLVGCSIHDNVRGLGPLGSYEYTVVQKGGKLTPLILIDCKLWNNGVHKNHKISDWVYINTTDDNIDAYTFTEGSLTVKWHVALKAGDKAGKPLAGLIVWLDAEGEQHDVKGMTAENGICRLDVAEFVKDKDGQRNYSYDVKIGTKSGEFTAIRENWTPTDNVEIEHLE